MYSFDYNLDLEKGQAVLSYRRHSDLGAGKIVILTGLRPSRFEPRVESPYTDTGIINDINKLVYCGYFYIFSPTVSSNLTSVVTDNRRSKTKFVKAFPCLAQDCVLSFDSQAKLDSHTEEDIHTTIEDIQDPLDKTKLILAEYINRGRGKQLLTSLTLADMGGGGVFFF